MPISSTPAALLRAVLAALVAARAPIGPALATLLLALLARLLARTDAAWDLAAWDEDEDEDEDGDVAWEHDEPPFGPSRIRLPPVGRAPHAACIEAGLVPDWILPGIRNRGMRPLGAPSSPIARTFPARAPPSQPHGPMSPPDGGRAGARLLFRIRN